jgi:undecaprenyl diphosphate synthase
VPPAELDLHRIPGHVAIVIEDGGHAAGERALVDVVDGALEIGLRWLTVDALPSHRWCRPLGEVEELVDLAERVLLERRQELHRRGVRIRVIGRRDRRLSRRLQRVIEETEAMTAGNHGLTLTLAMDYDGRAELADAFAAMTVAVREGALKRGTIDEDAIAALQAKRHVGGESSHAAAFAVTDEIISFRRIWWRRGDARHGGFQHGDVVEGRAHDSPKVSFMI